MGTCRLRPEMMPVSASMRADEFVNLSVRPTLRGVPLHTSVHSGSRAMRFFRSHRLVQPSGLLIITITRP
ncbi:MAG: hypothetical protein D6744_05120 [Planctomycetota bacterium]|nr:MAG: hypothetical protein D6744_05120 [Planctomycetota bacterium]